jgi:hypothetical protein
MDTMIAKPRVWQRWKAADHLALLAAFEDSTTCTRVKEYCQGLSRNLGEHCKIIQHVWVFSTFRLRELQEIAAEEASVADVVIISAHQAENLPDEVRSWVDRWLEQKGTQPAVLLALLDPVYEGAPNPIRAYLEDVARRGHMEFVVESAEDI